jgi:hypothetical protein
MGYIKHHAIVVVSYDEHINLAHAKAVEIFGALVSPVINGAANGYRSFFIAPDGSKEGWTLSYDYDSKRNKFIKYIENGAYSDGSNKLRYAEISFGGDTDKALVVRSN